MWQRASAITIPLCRIADQLEQQHKFRIAEQLRAATLSVSNNIAEGSGSASPAEFAQFVNISRRSVFEVANILMILGTQGLIANSDRGSMLDELQQLSRMLHSFRQNLLR